MYVCVCNGITDRTIREAVRMGATSLEELRASTGVATQCGRCAEAVIEILLEERPYATAESAAACVAELA